ncbi:UDPglucose 6-dehydrogenase [Devosia enhydra]|uniref:UDP-glucose 6-dehydrogenase n=1 Tax=Devosia enhydra TaxID=665118 RepID=A0A1K2I2Q3_9HYPH|nr:UDP-glucose/GDP-mannose dehydrogenase family protein [Devosia enhydra]SFZ86653.1 UDPglucose 6-dehydrogenase [Devosia enhydra]
MKLTIFGAGYVGLVTGACLAEVGHDVLVCDVDPARVDALKAGRIPIFEPGLEPLVRRNLAAGRLGFTLSAADAVAHSDLVMIAVGTPPAENGDADLGHVLAVGEAIATHMTRPVTVVTKSTVPVGTGDLVEARMRAVLSARGGAEWGDDAVSVVSNPEFLKEGAAVGDFMKPDRIIVGAASERATALMRTLYQPFNRNHDRLMVMDRRSAELTKYAANAMLATKISFMNEMAGLADRLGADIEAVRLGIGADPRIGYHFIYPGAGFGGSCFPKDVRALRRSGEVTGYEMPLVAAVEAVNDRQKHVMFEKLATALGGAEAIRGRTIAVWGLAFKPNTDDMREAPSLRLIDAVLAAGGTVRAYDPAAGTATRALYGERADLVITFDAQEALDGADALCLVTEWQEFRVPDFGAMETRMAGRIIIDGRNLYDPDDLAARGWRYSAIGRPQRVPAAG